jgi:hypothetical protein
MTLHLSIWATEKMVAMNGVKMRVWRGVAPGGVPVFLSVHRVAVAREEDQTEFERCLLDMPPPHEVSMRQVL